MGQLKVFRDIDELVTLKAAAQKGGRRPTEPDLSIIKNAAIITAKNKIMWVGRSRDIGARLFKKLDPQYKVSEVSFAGHSVLPAFIESHTHSVFAGHRFEEFELRNTGVSYQEIAQRGGGILSTVKATRRASLRQLVDLAQERIDRFIRQGVTVVEVKSGYALDEKNEIKMLRAALGLKGAEIVATYLGAHAVPNEYSSAGAYVEDICNKILPKVARQQLAQKVDIFIEKGYFDLTTAERYLKCAQKLGLGISIHADQLTPSGASALGAKYKALSVDHAVHLSDVDHKILANSETTAVLLPGADFYLKVAYPQARKLIDSGVRVALATDFNPGSCPTQDLSFIGLLARLEMKMTLPETIVAYTLGAAHALGLEHRLGSIEVGKQADFVVISGSWNELFYQVGRHPVSEVWRRSRRLFRKRS